MPRDMVQLLRDTAGVEGISGWARSLDLHGLHDFAYRYDAYAATWEHPRPRNDGLRPYVPVASPEFPSPYRGFTYDDDAPVLRPTVLGRLGFGITSSAAGAAAATTGTLAQRLKQYLLYCSAVAIDNPLGPIHEGWYAGRGPRVQIGSLQSQVLGDYAALIGELAPLIGSDALILVEHPAGIATPAEELPTDELRAERALLEEVDELTRPSPSELMFGDADLDLRHPATIDYARALSLANRTGVYDCYAPGRLQHALLNARRLCWQIVSEELGWPAHDLPAPDDRESRRLALLMGLELPNLDALPLGDIALVREEGEFETFRQDLERALDDALASGETDREVLRRMIAEELREPRERLERRIRTSVALGAVASKAPAKFVLNVASVDTTADLAWEAAITDGRLAEALTGVSGQAVVFGAIAAGWLGYREFRETMRADELPEPRTRRDYARHAARRHLCVFGTI